MPNVAEIIKDHVTLEMRCIDWLYLNAYVPRLQSAGGVIGFLVRAIPLQLVAVEVLWRPTFQEPLSAMTRSRSEYLTRRIPRARTLGHIAFA